MQEVGKRSKLGKMTKASKRVHVHGTYGAELLVDSIGEVASRRGHGASELAVAFGIHPSHWYRLRARPGLLARCERATHENIAAYIGWPLSRVLMASGLVEQRDLEFALGGFDVVNDCIGQIERSPLGASLVHPLSAATRDHQLLLAELFFSLKKEMASALSRAERQGKME